MSQAFLFETKDIMNKQTIKIEYMDTRGLNKKIPTKCHPKNHNFYKIHVKQFYLQSFEEKDKIMVIP